MKRAWALVLGLLMVSGGMGRGAWAEVSEEEKLLAEANAAMAEAERLMVDGETANVERRFAKQYEIYAAAVAPLEHACTRYETLRGPMDLDLARCLTLLGETQAMRNLGRHAKILLERALRIREAVLGKTHVDVANSLYQLGSIWAEPYERAEPLLKRALAIQEQRLGKEHPEIAKTLSMLANRAQDQGLHEEELQLREKALRIREKTLGEGHSETIRLLNLLSLRYTLLGYFHRAEPLIHRLLTLVESIYGKKHPKMIMALNTAAIFYFNQGFHSRAEQLWERALDISPDDDVIFGNWLEARQARGIYDLAGALKAVRLVEERSGKDDHTTVSSMALTGNVHTALGNYDQAEVAYSRALQNGEAANERDYTVDALQYWAEHYVIRGLYNRAVPLYARALALQEHRRGKNHPDVSETLSQLALAMLADHPLDAVFPLFDRAFQITDKHIREEGLMFSEGRLAEYLKKMRVTDELFYNLVHEHPGMAATAQRAMQAALLHKARSVQELSDISRSIYLHLDPADRQRYQQLRRLRSEQATVLLDGPGLQRTPEETRTRLEDLRTRVEAIETELAQRSVLLQAQRQQPTPEDILARVTAALPQDGVLIEFVAYDALPVLTPPRAPGLRQTGKPAYLALLLFPSGEIRTVDLGLADSIDEAVRDFRTALTDLTCDPRPAARTVYDHVMKPLVPHLGGRKRLIISPDGALNLVPFAALYDGTDELVATYDFTYVTSGRELLPRPLNRTPMDRNPFVVVFADPDFGTRTAPGLTRSTLPDLDSPLVARSAPLEHFALTQAEGLRTQRWMALPGTRREAEQIAAVFPHSRLFLGSQATAEALLQMSAPQVLHIATHGFFLRAPSISIPTPVPPSGRSEARTLTQSVVAPPAPPQDPMLRSGLALAGAKPVTALELSSMNLWGTELVVLSACDTGAGDVQAGQGVFGLRRAFTVAGAQTVVSSLWRVGDGTTGMLMGAFYRGLAAGQGRAEAMKQAMLMMRKTHPHPRDWAPFVVVGNGGPLSGARR